MLVRLYLGSKEKLQVVLCKGAMGQASIAVFPNSGKAKQPQYLLNPLLTNGFSHLYHLDESISVLGASGVIFHFYFR